VGAGDAPAGHTPAGLCVQTFLDPYTHKSAPAALKIDLRNRDLKQGSDGHIEDMGTIEQQVALAFGIPRGSLKHSPNIGHDFMTLPRLAQAALDAEIDRRAQNATPFDQLLAAGKVELISISKQHPKTTETRLSIQWRKVGDVTVRTTPVGR